MEAGLGEVEYVRCARREEQAERLKFLGEAESADQALRAQRSADSDTRLSPVLQRGSNVRRILLLPILNLNERNTTHLFCFF